MTIEDFRKKYENGDTPWDAGVPDFNLIEVVTGLPVEPCSALEVGCGTGDNSIWLAGKGFMVTGIDASELAINRGEEKAARAGVSLEFIVADFFSREIPGAPYGFLFDRGCFHTFETDRERDDFARRVAGLLEEEGLWLTLVGSTDGNPLAAGPPMRSAREIVLACEPYFRILSLTASHFTSRREDPPLAWRCLMKKRRV